MNTSVDQTIMDTAKGYVTDGFMFTAFDVTRATRRLVGKQTFVSHGSVNSIIQTMFANGELAPHTRTVINVGGGEPWLYHDPSSDITSYDSHWLDTNPNQTGVSATATPAPVNTTVATPSQSLKFLSIATGYKLTKEGRLNIPVSMVSKTFGSMSYTAINVRHDGSKIILERTPSLSLIRPDIVTNGDGRIRVCRSILSAISKNPEKSLYKIESDNSSITIQTV